MELEPDFDAIEADTGADAKRLFEAWKAGETGFPIVDAGMRQLRETGFMHNPVRMIVVSFLVKDLHLPWQWGARWQAITFGAGFPSWAASMTST